MEKVKGKINPDRKVFGCGLKFDCRGSVSVFLLLIFTALLFLAGVLIDAARIMTAERKIEMALHTAVRSVMAGCDRTLAGEFGVYGLSCSCSKEDSKKYFTANLIERNKNLNFINYDVKKFEICATGNSSLLSNTEYEQQILQYMKYKAPLLISENIMEKISHSHLGERMEVAEKSKDLAKIYRSLTNEVKKINVELQDIEMLYQVSAEKSLDYLEKLQKSLRKLQDTVVQYQENLVDINGNLEDLAEVSGETYTNLSALDEHKMIMENINTLDEDIVNNISILKKVISMQNDKEKKESISDLLKNWQSLKKIEITSANSLRSLDKGNIQKKEALIQRLWHLCDKEIKDVWLIKKGDRDETGSKLDLQGNEETFAQQAEKMCKNIETLKTMLKKLEITSRNRVFISEYILDKYTFATSRTERNHYFQKGETEYILCGNNKEIVNIMQVFAKIWSLRFTVNTIDKMITSKFPQFLLRFADALTEGFIRTCADMYKLYRGEGVFLCPSMSKGKAGITFKYSDHLRFLLLLQNKETQLDRMRQLAQIDVKMINSDFELKNITSQLRGSAEVSINLWFMPLFHLDKLGIRNFTGDKYMIKREFILEY